MRIIIAANHQILWDVEIKLKKLSFPNFKTTAKEPLLIKLAG